MRNTYSQTALTEYMLQGNPITRVEAMIWFGVQNLPANLRQIRVKHNLTMVRRRVTLDVAMQRIPLEPFHLLPSNEIVVSEWEIERQV